MMMGSPGSPASPLQSQFLPGYLLGDTTQHAVSVRFNMFFFLLYWAKDLYFLGMMTSDWLVDVSDDWYTTTIYRTKLGMIGCFVLSFLICFRCMKLYCTFFNFTWYRKNQKNFSIEPTTEQKLINSFWNALRIRRKINQLHQSLCYTSSIYYTKQSLDLPI
jgi:hypothetical protein